ncbi:hypothetical protein [Metabacillus endolithicus]|uniref:Uncharacterized protein n=1 Tax=Metabacillus endolithicus TaxID=1535204 RepID=A0ABW5C3Y3_9BACI|nr:hypothetical protein [Metabacillus endolithicus]
MGHKVIIDGDELQASHVIIHKKVIGLACSESIFAVGSSGYFII